MDNEKNTNGFGDFEGIVVTVGRTMEVGTRGFKKREIVVDNDPQAEYPNPVKFTFKKDKCDLLNAYKGGERVTIRYAIDGRRWDGPKGTQYFVDLTGLSIKKVGDGNEAPEPATPPEVMPTQDDLDMPF